MARYFKIKRGCRYVKGVIGLVVRLSLRDRLRILLSNGVEVVLTEAKWDEEDGDARDIS